MGIILSTISTFFSIINKLVLIINVIFLVGFILSVVYLGPKFKIIFDAFTSLQEFNTKLTDILYESRFLKTTIANNCLINNFTWNNINTSHLSSTTSNLQSQIYVICTKHTN